MLEAGGFEVVVPRAGLCCGRPLYDFGMLDKARKQLLQILEELRPEIERGTRIVGLEPSCVAVFRDELPNLLAHDQDANRLREQVVTLAEFVAEHPDEFDFAPLEGKALVHGHCHDRALTRMKGYAATLDQLGLEHVMLQDTCCGLAGAFGFEAEHYDVSMAVGEHSLLPAVRAAEQETFILSDGFSCREQIAHATERRALHLAELLQLTLHGEGLREGGPRERGLERLCPPDLVEPGLSTGSKLLAAAAGAAVLGAGLWGLLRRVRQ